MRKKLSTCLALAMALGAVAQPGYAANAFYLVVPVPTRAPAPDSIRVSLTGAALPNATVNQAYSESLRPYLAVTGDPSYDVASVRWSLAGGMLPAGLALDPVTGVLAGTPTAATANPITFTVRSTYKGKNGQADYTIDVPVVISVSLAGGALAKATVNKVYSESLRPYLTVTGDAARDIDAARWSLVEGTLPAGLALDANTGALTGTPTAKTTTPASVTILAAYKGQDDQAVYTIEVAGQVLRVKQIAQGGWHTCAVTIDGTAKCWGQNNYGQLGNNSTVNSSVPVDVAIGAGVQAIAPGAGHTCAILTGGAVKCWGLNSDGQLGNGSTLSSTQPVDVSSMGSGVVAVSANQAHTCAVTAERVAKCWGSNSNGQLGNNSTTSSSVPVTVAAAGGVSTISTGLNFTCAVTPAGDAVCWGANGAGQLGNNSTADSSIPVSVATLSSVTSITAGYRHACAIAGGVVKCWGPNLFGQLGDSSQQPSLVPVVVPNLGPGATWVQTRMHHTCAITAGGVAKCWGMNGNGQLGDGSTSTSSPPVIVEGLGSGVVAINPGAYHTCAMTSEGAVKCWGQGTVGQLGNNSNSDSLIPVEVGEQ